MATTKRKIFGFGFGTIWGLRKTGGSTAIFITAVGGFTGAVIGVLVGADFEGAAVVFETDTAGFGFTTATRAGCTDLIWAQIVTCEPDDFAEWLNPEDELPQAPAGAAGTSMAQQLSANANDITYPF